MVDEKKSSNGKTSAPKKTLETAADLSEKSSKSAASGDFDVDFEKLEIKVEDMFKSGMHFGHHKSRKNPKMDEFIFTTRNGINIINLERTKEKLKEAMEFITRIVSEGQELLLVGTKKQAKKIIKEAAEKCGMPYVSERWLGGTFTNFKIVSARAKYLRDESEKMKQGEFSKYTKFEQMKKMEELEGLERKIGGIKNMVKLPAAIFVASAQENNLTIKEAINSNIPVIALVDTNIDPSEVNYPIPSNEDAVSSLKLMLKYICKAILEGKKKTVDTKKEIEKK
jgi:small subunit ribosomal protein S2